MWVSLVAFLQVALASAGRNETKNPAVSWLMEGGNVERTGSLQGSPGIAGWLVKSFVFTDQREHSVVY